VTPYPAAIATVRAYPVFDRTLEKLARLKYPETKDAVPGYIKAMRSILASEPNCLQARNCLAWALLGELHNADPGLPQPLRAREVAEYHGAAVQLPRYFFGELNWHLVLGFPSMTDQRGTNLAASDHVKLEWRQTLPHSR
jgi:hypothetical protein